MEDDNNVYIGRRGIVFITTTEGKFRYPSTDSIWANPYKISEDFSREDVIKHYRKYILKKLKDEEIGIEELWALEALAPTGKILGCHGDVLVSILEHILEHNSLPEK